jgi:uncharacterized protein with NAD-binding domain and iron-sulfur cluster
MRPHTAAWIASGCPVRTRRKKTVAVFGGGVAGLTAAHELADRGFKVTVYERRAWGGKARSMDVPGTASGGRRPLPGEHGFRVEFGCYLNATDTMRRIPFAGNPNGVFNNLVPMPQLSFGRMGKSNLVLPLHHSEGPRSYTPEQVIDSLMAAFVELQLPPAGLEFLGRRMAVFMSSCDARRIGQWEKTSWADFIAMRSFGQDYENIFGRAPEITVGSKADITSTKYMAWVIELFAIYGLLGRGSNGPALRLFNGPTSEAWIDPWIAELRRVGVRLRIDHEVTRLEMRDGRIASALLRTPRGRERVAADWYVCALPVERARRLWNRAIRQRDPRLRAMSGLITGRVAAMQFFLSERSRMAKGTMICADSPWFIACTAQAQFWPTDFAATYGDGRSSDVLTALMAEWDASGVLFAKSADDCDARELALDVWEQIKRHINKPGRAPVLTDEMLVTWAFQPGLRRQTDSWLIEEPLIQPIVDTERFRPDVETRISNLMLCGDYLNGNWEVVNQEAANYNGRRAANAILGAAGSKETPVEVLEPYRPPEWEPFKQIDEERWRQGQPNIFDTEMSSRQLHELLKANPELLTRLG